MPQRRPKTPGSASLAPSARASFTSARKFVRGLKLRKRDEWRRFVKSKDGADELKNHHIPSRPDKAYRQQGWSAWSDWLGSNLFQPKTFMPYAQWRDWLTKQPFRRQSDYNDWCKSNSSKPDRLQIPSSPSAVYSEFRGWREELSHARSTKQVTRTPLTYTSFQSARAFVRALLRSSDWDKLGYKRTYKGWQAYAQTHKQILRRQNIPASPDSVAQYRSNWRGWRDFFGTNTRSTLNRKR